MSSTLCTAIANWVRENDYPIHSTELMPSWDSRVWCLTLAKNIYILAGSCVNLIQLVPHDDEANRLKVVATLEPSDPVFFQKLREALDSIPRSCYSEVDEPLWKDLS